MYTCKFKYLSSFAQTSGSCKSLNNNQLSGLYHTSGFKAKTGEKAMHHVCDALQSRGKIIPKKVTDLSSSRYCKIGPRMKMTYHLLNTECYLCVSGRKCQDGWLRHEQNNFLRPLLWPWPIQTTQLILIVHWIQICNAIKISESRIFSKNCIKICLSNKILHNWAHLDVLH